MRVASSSSSSSPPPLRQEEVVGVRAHALLELAGRPRRRETRAAGFEKIDFLNVVFRTSECRNQF